MEVKKAVLRNLGLAHTGKLALVHVGAVYTSFSKHSQGGSAYSLVYVHLAEVWNLLIKAEPIMFNL